MAKHTATPWKVWDFEVADIVSINQQDGGSRIADIPNGGPSGDKRANAAHIVKCVNNHDALVRVIRLLGQADALGYVGEQAAPIMEEALSLASDILKREVK